MHDKWTSAELDSLLGPVSVGRREILMTSLAVGFAMAVRPVSAGTITTDSKGLVAGEVRIPVPDGEIPGYRAMPESGGPFPVVLVVQEIFGVHEHIKDVCRRFAKEGYLAVAPELYARQGDVSQYTDYRQIFSAVVSKVPDSQVMSDLDAAAAWAQKSGGGRRDALGVTGFCWGGRITWLYAAHNPRLKAGVAWYGRLAGEASELTDVEQMRSALATAKQPSEIVVFSGAPHGFHADYRASYRPEQAQQAWRQCLEWFRKNGVG
jgi:carboxymethylenebutenolidase